MDLVITTCPSLLEKPHSLEQSLPYFCSGFPSFLSHVTLPGSPPASCAGPRSITFRTGPQGPVVHCIWAEAVTISELFVLPTAKFSSSITLSILCLFVCFYLHNKLLQWKLTWLSAHCQRSVDVSFPSVLHTQPSSMLVGENRPQTRCLRSPNTLFTSFYSESCLCPASTCPARRIPGT